MPSLSSRARKPVLLGLVVAAWLGVVGTGMAALTRYKETPGVQANAPERWPDGVALARSPSRPTLLMFAHPMCPCTRASLSELSKLVARLGDRLDVHVLFVRPEGTSEDWATSDLWRSARAIPGAQVEPDPSGSLADRFGSATSGQVLLYDADGTLAFRGGITAARGHEGDSPGAATIAAHVMKDGGAEGEAAPVFGCPLEEEQATGSKNGRAD